MNENERTESIKQVQRALRTLSKNGDDIPEVKEDGIFGSETTEAVRAFQRNAGPARNEAAVVYSLVYLRQRLQPPPLRG